jgi:hypothetical protein
MKGILADSIFSINVNIVCVYHYQYIVPTKEGLSSAQQLRNDEAFQRESQSSMKHVTMDL